MAIMRSHHRSMHVSLLASAVPAAEHKHTSFRHPNRLYVSTACALVCVVAMAVLLVLPALADASTLSGVVSGQLAGQSSQPLQYAVVTVLDHQTQTTVAEASTSSSGEYSLSVPSGVYDVRFDPGPRQAYGSKTLQNINLAESRVFDITLGPNAYSEVASFPTDTGPAPFYPYNLAIAPSGDVYASGSIFVEGRRGYSQVPVEAFSASGQFLQTLGVYTHNESTLGGFDDPLGVAVNSSEDIFVADGVDDRIQEFTASGEYVQQIGERGSAGGELSEPDGVAMSPGNVLYVVDAGHGLVKAFNATTGQFLYQFGDEGPEEARLVRPGEIAVDGEIVYVTEERHVAKFTTSGMFLGYLGGYGFSEGQIASPSAVAVDSNHNVYVLDEEDQCIKKFNASGEFLEAFLTWDAEGSTPYPYFRGIAVAPDGNIYLGAATGEVDVWSETTTAPQPPQVISVEPGSGREEGGTSVTITGVNLQEASSVMFGAAHATGFTVNSPTTITAVTPRGAGTVDITVTTPGGTSATSAADHFTYMSTAPAPAVTKVSPAKGLAAGGRTVKIKGTGFTGATAVQFGSEAAASYKVNSATSITAVSPASSAGTVDITVTTPNGTSPTSSADHFTFEATTVTKVSPVKGPAAGGTTVTIKGTGFTGATAVRFGSEAAASYTVNSATSITAVSPASSAGTVDITVTTSNGTSPTGSADHFTFD